MCGIIAVVRRPARRTPPSSGPLLDDLDAALAALGVGPARLAEAAAAVAGVDRELRGVPGISALLTSETLSADLEGRLAKLETWIASTEADLDAGRIDLGNAQLEAVNAGLVALKDAAWAIGHDRLRAAREVAALAGDQLTPSAIEAFTSVQQALSAVDRLEVRGRDSAGINLLVSG